MKKETAVLWAVLTLLLAVGAFLIGYHLMKTPDSGNPQIQIMEPAVESVSETPPAVPESTTVSVEAVVQTEPPVTAATESEPEVTTTTTAENALVYPDDYSFVMSGYVSTKKSNLMMRVRPDADAACVFSEGIERGKPVEVFGSGMGTDGTMWYFVKYNGNEGWCKAVYITKEAPEPLPADPPKTENFRTDYLTPDYYVEYPNHCETIVGELNLRSGPGEGYSSYLQLPRGAQLEEIGYNYNNSDWIFTCYNGQYGWAKTNNNGKIYIQFSGGIEKPVIYIYPLQDTIVNVHLSLKTSTLATTYPDYGDGWRVLAKPDGSLINLADGSHHSYLFWDSCNDRTHYDLSKGFCVRGTDTEAFLKEKLRFMGLTEPEMNDFIVYWLPKMEHNNFNLISFQTDTYEEAVGLTVTPEPDSMLRLFMAYVPLEEKVSAAPQKLEPFTRRGYTVVEWGGTELQ